MCTGGSRRGGKYGGVSRGQRAFVWGVETGRSAGLQRCVVRHLQSGDGRELSTSGSSPVLDAIPCAPEWGGEVTAPGCGTGSSRGRGSGGGGPVRWGTDGSDMSSRHPCRRGGVPVRGALWDRSKRRRPLGLSVARLIHLGHTKPCRAAWFVQGGTQRIERGWRCRRRRGHPGAGIWSGRNHSSHALCRRTLELRWEEKGVAPKPIH